MLRAALLLLLALLPLSNAQTATGEACAALRELEDTYKGIKQTEVFNIVDPQTSTQCTWSPSEQRICKGVGGVCEHDEL